MSAAKGKKINDYNLTIWQKRSYGSKCKFDHVKARKPNRWILKMLKMSAGKSTKSRSSLGRN